MKTTRILSQRNCKFGAPLGRADYIPGDYLTVTKLHLVKLRWIDGDYTIDGTYWGNSGGTSIYWAYGDSETEQADMFIRAKSRKDAREQAIAKFPMAK